MKKNVFSLLVILVLTFAFINSSMAEDVFANEYKVVLCNEYITLRDEASTKADALDRVPLGAAVTALSEAENGFYYVNYNGKTGYVLSRYLEFVPSYIGTAVTLTESQRKDLNLFLSNFTEQAALPDLHDGGKIVSQSAQIRSLLRCDHRAPFLSPIRSIHSAEGCQASPRLPWT